MKQIEIISDNNIRIVQEDVNNFLKEKDDTIRIKDIKLSSMCGYCEYRYVVMIIYEVV